MSGGVPSLGHAAEAILEAFEAASLSWCGVRIVEAVVVGGAVYRCDGRGGFCVAVEDVYARAATTAEVASLRRGLALGQVRIQARMRRQFQTVETRVLHEATGCPLDERSPEARYWEIRLAALEQRRGEART
jgi:hypothetical protein